jgi:hypothetical protein
MRFKSLILLALAVLATPLMANTTTTSKKIAIMAAISDEIAVVRHQAKIGSSLNQNVSGNWPLPLGPFNNAALLAADEAVKLAEPNSSTVLLDIPDLAKQANLLDKQRFNPASDIRDTLNAQGVTHVLLISKLRSKINFANPPGYVGHGTLEGLGFFVDNDFPLIDRQTRKNSSGFITPHAFFKLSLIDLASSTVQKEQAITASETYFSEHTFKAWDMITDQQKLESLIGMIKDETSRNVALMLR